MTIAIFLACWTIASVPIAILAGRMIAFGMNSGPLPRAKPCPAQASGLYSGEALSDD
jgi:hypothetical protein